VEIAVEQNGEQFAPRVQRTGQRIDGTGQTGCLVEFR
jgi:hypothetical protein